MTWPKWNVLVHQQNRATPCRIGTVKARSMGEAIRKGKRLSRSWKVSGRIEIEQTIFLG